jgi:phage gpG-like protein
MKVEFDDKVFRAALNRLAAGMDDMTEPMDQIGEFLVVTTKRRFETGIAPDGTSWAQNSPVTLARKKETRPLIGESKSLSRGINHEASRHEVVVGSPMIYAGVQQRGAAQGEFGAAIGRTKPSDKRPRSQDYFFPIPWGNIPARPFIGLSEEDETGLLDIVTEWLDGLAGAP